MRRREKFVGHSAWRTLSVFRWRVNAGQLPGAYRAVAVAKDGKGVWQTLCTALPRRFHINLLCSVLLVVLFFAPLRATSLDLSRLLSVFSAINPNGANLFAAWEALLKTGRNASLSATLAAVNGFFNERIAFDSDLNVWGKNDYWATPMETLARQKGDCEDFAIAKYFTLIATGVPEDRLRLVYVLATFNGAQQAHMVLAYYSTPDAEPLILDNLNPAILPASARADLKPVFSLGQQDLAPTEPFDSLSVRDRMKAATQKSRLTTWQDLVRRAKAEGFN
jgi:predicted transglutaminase-like cysteine proteinase